MPPDVPPIQSVMPMPQPQSMPPMRHSASLSPCKMPVRGTRDKKIVVDVTDSSVLNTTRWSSRFHAMNKIGRLIA